MEHPSPEALEHFEAGSVDAGERARIDEHIAACAVCREALAAMRSGDYALTLGLDAPAGRRAASFGFPQPPQIRASRARPGSWRERWLRAMDPQSPVLPAVGVFTLVGVLVPALWLAS